VPIAATRLPCSETEWSQRAEWKAGPSKRSSPGKAGILGSTSGPVPLTSTRARTGPCEVWTSHRLAPSSQRAPSTVQDRRMWGAMPKSSTTRRRYSRNSGCLE
jgi:hypothetical protein